MDRTRLRLTGLAAPAAIFAAFWALGIVLWSRSGQIFWIINFGYIGTSVAAGMALYGLLPKPKKHIGRKLAQFLVGVYMLGLLGLVAGENMQIEGFFFYLFAGFVGGAVVHYLVAKIIGPVLFGRSWCSWACWTAMVLDLLPFTQNPGGRRRSWGMLRYAHFAVSLAVVAALWFGFGYRLSTRAASLTWLIGGNAIYYVAAIAMAFALRDNRAFCKYACPIPAAQKITSRFSLLKIAGNPSICTDCGACQTVCPMDVRIPEYVRNGKRVLASECIFCLTCTNACASGALHVSFGFDAAAGSLLRFGHRG